MDIFVYFVFINIYHLAPRRKKFVLKIFDIDFEFYLVVRSHVERHFCYLLITHPGMVDGLLSLAESVDFFLAAFGGFRGFSSFFSVLTGFALLLPSSRCENRVSAVACSGPSSGLVP